MATLPYVTKNPNKVFGALKMYSRVGAFPLDPTSVFETVADVQSYINETGSYAYAGQVIAVANGTIDATNGSKDYSLYVIRSDKSLQKLGDNMIFADIATAEAYVTANPSIAVPGHTLTVGTESGAYEVYVIKADKSLQRVSFDVSDVPDVTWANLQNKPTSTVEQIDAAVATAEKFTAADGVLSYDGKALANAEDLDYTKLANVPTEFKPESHTHEDADIKGLSSSKLIGVIPIDLIPKGAVERCVVVADDEARFALTAEQVQTGDTVKVTATNKMYFVKDDTKLATEDGYEVYTAGSATSVPWSGVTERPTTIDGYGITDAVNSSEVVTTATANKLLKLDASGKLPADITGDAATLGGKAPSAYSLDGHGHAISGITGLETELTGIKDGSSITALDASKLTGVVDVANLPEGTVTKLHVVADDNERFALLRANVANADLVKVESTGNMYVVRNNASLASEDGYEVFTGEATTIQWANVQSKPTTIAGYGITDAVNSSEVVTTAEGNKILKLDGDGKLPASITGDAATVGGRAADSFANASHQHGNDDITDVDWSKVQNAPTTLAGYGITDAVNSSEIVETATANKVLKLNANAKLPADITGDAATVGGRAADSFANAEHGHTIAEVETLEQELADIKAGTSITALAASKLTGTIDIARLPHGSLERCVVVADDTARFALTADQVQTGDTVKVTSTAKMYFVTDSTKLSTEAGYEVYTAGSATSVPWSGVEGKPEFGTGAGQFAEGDHTHTAADVGAVDATEVVTVAAPNKILKLNADGKLDADITGSVNWGKIVGAPTSTPTAIDEAVTAANHTNRAVLDKLTEVDGVVNYNGAPVAMYADLSKVVVASASEPADLMVGGIWLEEVSRTTVE